MAASKSTEKKIVAISLIPSQIPYGLLWVGNISEHNTFHQGVHPGNFVFRCASSWLSISFLGSVLLGIRNVADKVVEKISTQDLCSISFENCAVYETM